MKKIILLIFVFTMLDAFAADQKSIGYTEVVSATNAIIRPPGSTTTATITATKSPTATPSAANTLGVLSWEQASAGPLTSQIIIKGNSGDTLSSFGVWTSTRLLLGADLAVSGVIKDAGITSPANTVLGVDSTGAFSEYKTVTAGAGVSVTHGVNSITYGWSPSTQVNSFSLWDGSQATRTITYNLSGTDPVWTIGSSSVDLTTGTLKVGGNTVSTVNNIAPAFTTLTDGATITWTVSASLTVQNGTVTLGGNRTLAFSGIAAGMTGVLIVKQDGTGSRTLTLPASSKVIGGGAGAITLTTTASAIDILTWVYDGTNYYWNKGLNYN